MPQNPYPSIIAGSSTGAQAALSINSSGSDSQISIRTISAIANVSSELHYYVTNTIIYSIAEKAYYKYNGTNWVITTDLITSTTGSANYSTSSGSSTISALALTSSSATNYNSGGNIESNINRLTTQDQYHYSGVRLRPTITDSGTGSLIAGSGIYALYPDSLGSENIQVFTLSGSTFYLQENITTYIYVKYNSGSPTIAATTNRGDVVDTNFTDATPIYTCYRYGNVINIIDWDEQGLALGEKLLLRCIDTDRFHRTNGLILNEYGTRNITVSSGSVYYGANSLDIQDFWSGSSNNYLYLLQHDASNIWTGSLVTQYNNSQYQSATGLSTLTSNRYAVNWIYRFVSATQRYCGIVLGTGDYKIDEAIVSQPPSSLPNVVQTQGILVGRIIVQKGLSVSTEIDSAFDISFTPTSLDHNLLSGLQGGDSTLGEYFHLNSTQYNNTINTYTYSSISTSTPYNMTSASRTLFASGSGTINLFTPVGNAGIPYRIKSISGSSITISGSGFLIDGVSSQILNPYDCMEIESDNSNWWII